MKNRLRASSFAAWMLTLLASVLGCAPLASFRPASGLPDDRHVEFGAGSIYVSPRPYVEEPGRAAGQLWASKRTSRRTTLTGVAAFDNTAFALGGTARWDIVRDERVSAGIEPELGFLWGGVRFPVAVRFREENFLYFAPRVAARSLDVSLDLPVGMSLCVADGVFLRGEYGVSWTGELSYYQRRQMLGAGIAVQR